MTTWLVVGIGVIGFCLAFLWWSRKPYVHRDVALETLNEFFEVLLSRGELGGQMFVATEPTGVVLPFVKYGTNDAGGIRFALPLTEESQTWFKEVEQRLAGRGFHVLRAEPSSEEPRPIIFVNLGQDLREATRLVSVALGVRSDIQASTAAPLNVWFKNVGPGPIRRPKGDPAQVESADPT